LLQCVSNALYVSADDFNHRRGWTGGITELVKICALASAFGVPVVAHGHSLLAALHVAGAQSPATVPLVEFLIQHQERKQFFHTPIYRPVEGSLELPALPGLGLVLDEGKIEAREPPCSQPPSSGAAAHDRRVLTHINRPETGLRAIRQTSALAVLPAPVLGGGGA